MKESQEQNKIIFDKAIIFKSLDKFGEYKNEKLKTTIKKWEDDDITSNMFIIKIDGDCQFLGVINGLFEVIIISVIFQKMKEINMVYIHLSRKLKMILF